jgi:hypothetical protein
MLYPVPSDANNWSITWYRVITAVGGLDEAPLKENPVAVEKKV